MGTIGITDDFRWEDTLDDWNWFPAVTTEIPPLNLDRTPPPPPKKEPIAHIRWGGKTGVSFTADVTNSITVVNPSDIPPVEGVLDFVEVERTEDVVRIFNPDDNTQWVDVARARTVTKRPPAQLLKALNQPVTQLWRDVYNPPS
jgi:hypothetical protein